MFSTASKSADTSREKKTTFASNSSNGRAHVHAKMGHTNMGTAKIALKRDLPSLDRIHFLFLMYSGAHNLINAWHRAEHALFFIFVLVGILSVELMLYAIYKHWKDGRLVGKMLSIGKTAGAIAMFYATAGILAQAQAGGANEWITFYYQWILPTSAPVMFVFAFWIQSVDPIMTAERDSIAHDHLVRVETKQVELDRQRLTLIEKRDVRRLESHVKRQKLLALWKESTSRRTKRYLKQAVQEEVPLLLERVGIRANVPKGKISTTRSKKPRKQLTGKSGGSKKE